MGLLGGAGSPGGAEEGEPTPRWQTLAWLTPITGVPNRTNPAGVRMCCGLGRHGGRGNKDREREKQIQASTAGVGCCHLVFLLGTGDCHETSD